jgi:uncharacterized membrane protein
MPRLALAVIAAAVVMLILDGIWLTLATPLLYKPGLGELVADPPNLVAAAAFYLLYLSGVVVFAIRPALAAGSLARAAGLGAFLGLVAYGTYDLTNLATLRAWPAGLSIIDMIWGTCLTATTAVCGFWVANRFGRA